MEQVGDGMGSNPAGVFEDRQGQRFYVKTLASPMCARNEFLAAELYQLAGVPILTYVATTRLNQVATEWVRLEKKSVAELSPEERKQAQRWFGVHAWLANWDAAGGYGGGNQGVAAGVVLTLDVGGALDFRAQGSPKGAAFGTHVGEVDSLRVDPGNPSAMALFGDMSMADVRAAIEVVARIPDALIRQLVTEQVGRAALTEKLIARKVSMVRRLVETAR